MVGYTSSSGSPRARSSRSAGPRTPASSGTLAAADPARSANSPLATRNRARESRSSSASPSARSIVDTGKGQAAAVAVLDMPVEQVGGGVEQFVGWHLGQTSQASFFVGWHLGQTSQ